MPPKGKKKPVDFNNLGTAGNDIVQVPHPIISNVVSTFSLGMKLDLKKIAEEQQFVEFNPANFAAATLRVKEPRTTALAFQSGNMVCTGAATEHHSRLAARKYVRILQKIGLRVSFNNFKIQNIVAAAATGFTIKLHDIAADFGPYTSYEAELFPGLIFRSIEPKLVFLIFRSGKVVITGAKHKSEITSTYESLYRNILVKYKDIDGSTSSSSEYRNQTRQNKMVKIV